MFENMYRCKSSKNAKRWLLTMPGLLNREDFRAVFRHLLLYLPVLHYAAACYVEVDEVRRIEPAVDVHRNGEVGKMRQRQTDRE